jgi:hypothetical protein
MLTGEPSGYRGLRQAIADHAASTRGVVASVDQVIITSGAQQAFNLVFQLLLNSGDDGPNAAGAAVLTHRFWTTALKSDPSVIGKTVRLDTRTATHRPASVRIPPRNTRRSNACPHRGGSRFSSGHMIRI